ncbi:hypothetical protein AURDEDRAFT_188486 [Auricularia subglabra TFB-10046 SS5]|nr:hypothetical protein AURDEDRAFT_188486 [Auricularia subglabra TFB-10046 SS5]
MSVITGQRSDPTEPELTPAISRGWRPGRAGLRAHFEDDDGDGLPCYPVTPSRRKRAVSESASRQPPPAKRTRVDAKLPSKPRAAKQLAARPARRPSLPSPPTSSPRTTRSSSARAITSAARAPVVQASSSSSESDSSDDDYTAPRRLPLVVKTSTKSRSQLLFINDDNEGDLSDRSLADASELAQVHESLRAENLERTLFRAKPHLIQEPLSGNAWLVILASSMLDAYPLHQRKQITTVFCTLSGRWPTADAILSAPEDELKAVLGALDAYLPKLQTLAGVFVRCPVTASNWRTESCWAPPYTPYVRDAYRTFCVRDEWKKVLPQPDSDLAQYLQWRWARAGTMWHPEFGCIGPIKTSQVRKIIIKSWAPLFHILPYSFAIPHSTPVRPAPPPP